MRESQRRIFSGLILLLWHFAVSCTPVEYSIVVVNNTPGMVSDAEVSYGSFQHIGGWIGPGARKTHGGVTEPLARQASVTWRTPDGLLHQRLVPVPQVDRHFTGEMVFMIGTGDDVVVTISRGDR